jgi:hypothetical protein
MDRATASCFERDTGEADVPDLALVLEIFKRADRLCEGDGWVRGVQLVEIDAVELEPAQRCLAGGAEMSGAAVGGPARQLAAFRQAARSAAFVAALGRNEEAGIG